MSEVLAWIRGLTSALQPTASRAKHILDHAYHLLQERAAKIIDEDMRRSFLQNMAAHREIVDEYSKVHQSPGQ